MSHSYAAVWLHIVFGTKNRLPFLNDAIRPELHAYVATVLKNLDCPALLAFSVSPSRVETVRRYIARQAEHHRRMTFQEEFEELRRRHGCSFDPAALWRWSLIECLMPPPSGLTEGIRNTRGSCVPPQADARGYFRAPSGLETHVQHTVA
jgi:hypothetical protein